MLFNLIRMFAVQNTVHSPITQTAHYPNSNHPDQTLLSQVLYNRSLYK